MTDHKNILTPPLMLVRYAGMASLLTTVWASRRELQDRVAELETERDAARAELEQSRRASQGLGRYLGDLDAALGRAIDERDTRDDLLDELTAAVEALLHTDFGEHSSASDPWHNALEALKAASHDRA